MADFRAKIPGWLEAVQNEAETHDLAFAAPHDVVAGVAVRHLSLLDLCRLRRLGSPFVGESFPRFLEFCNPDIRLQAAELIAYQSLGYSPRRNWRFHRTRRKVERVKPAALYAELVEYFRSTFVDQLPDADTGRKSQAQPWSNVVGYIDLLGKEYGWTSDYVLTMPYRQLIQITRKIIKREDPKLPLSTTSDRVVAEYLRRKNEANREATEAKEQAKEAQT